MLDQEFVDLSLSQFKVRERRGNWGRCLFHLRLEKRPRRGRTNLPSPSPPHPQGKKYVVLFFYPLDWTFVCPTEITAFDDRIAEFEKLGAGE